MGQPTTQDNQKVFNSSTQNLQSFMEQAGGPSNSKNMEAIYNNMAKLFDTFTNGSLKEQGANAEILMRTIYRALDRDFLNIVQDSDAASKIADELKGKSGSKQPSSGSTSTSKSNDQAASTAKQTKQETKEDLTQVINDFIAELQEAIMQVKMKLARQKDQQLSSQPQIPTQEPKKGDTGQTSQEQAKQEKVKQEQTGQEQNVKEAQEEQSRISDAIETLKDDDETETEEHLSKTEQLFQTFNGKDKDSGILGYLKNTMKQMSEDGELKQFFKNGNFNAKNLVETIKKTSAALLKGKTDLEKEQGKKRDAKPEKAKTVEPKPMSKTVHDEHGQKAKPTELKDGKALNTLVKDSQEIAKQVQKNQKQPGMKQLVSGKINPKKEEQKQTVPEKQENTKLKPSPVKGMCVCPICGNSHCKGPSAHMSSGSKLQSKPNMQPLGKSGDKPQSSIDNNGVLSTLGKIHDNASKMIKQKKFRRNFSINYAGIQNQVKKNMKKVDKGENQVKKDLDKTEDGIGKLKRNQQGNLLSRLIFGGPIQTVLVTAAGAIILITLARAAWRSWKEQYMPQTDEKTYTLFGFTIPGVSQIKAFFKGIRNFVVVGLPIYYNKAKTFFKNLYKELFDKRKGLLRSSEVIYHNLIRIGLAWVIGQTKQIGGKALGWLLKYIAKAAKFVPGWGTAIGFLLEFAPELYVFITTQLMNIWGSKKDESLSQAEEMERKAKERYKAPINHLRRRLRLYTRKIQGFTTPGEFPALKSPHWDPSDIDQSRPKKMAIWVKPSRPKYADSSRAREQQKAAGEKEISRTDRQEQWEQLRQKQVNNGVTFFADDVYTPIYGEDGELKGWHNAGPSKTEGKLYAKKDDQAYLFSTLWNIDRKLRRDWDWFSSRAREDGFNGEDRPGDEEQKDYETWFKYDSSTGTGGCVQIGIIEATRQLEKYIEELTAAREKRFSDIDNIYDPETGEWNKRLYMLPTDLRTKMGISPFHGINDGWQYIGVPSKERPFAWYPAGVDGKLADTPIYVDPYLYEIEKAKSAMDFLGASWNYLYYHYTAPQFIHHIHKKNELYEKGLSANVFEWGKNRTLNFERHQTIMPAVTAMINIWRADTVPTATEVLDSARFNMEPLINEIEAGSRLGYLSNESLSGNFIEYHSNFIKSAEEDQAKELAQQEKEAKEKKEKRKKELEELRKKHPLGWTPYGITDDDDDKDKNFLRQMAKKTFNPVTGEFEEREKKKPKLKLKNRYADAEQAGQFLMLDKEFGAIAASKDYTYGLKRLSSEGNKEKYNSLTATYYPEWMRQFFMGTRVEELINAKQIRSIPSWANHLMGGLLKHGIIPDDEAKYTNKKIEHIAGLINWMLSSNYEFGWGFDLKDQTSILGFPLTREEWLQEHFFDQWDTINAFSYAMTDYFKYMVLPEWIALESHLDNIAMGQEEEDSDKIEKMVKKLDDILDPNYIRKYMFMHVRPQAAQIQILDYDDDDLPEDGKSILDRYRNKTGLMTQDEKFKYFSELSEFYYKKMKSASKDEVLGMIHGIEKNFKNFKWEAGFTGDYHFVDSIKDWYGFYVSGFNDKWADHGVKFDKIPGLVDADVVERKSRPVETEEQRQARKDKEQKRRNEENKNAAEEAKKKLASDAERAEALALGQAIIKEQEAIRKQEEKYESVLERLVGDPKSVTAKELEDFGEQVKNLKQEAENRINKLPRKDRDVRLSLLRGDTVSPQTFKEMKDTAIGLHGSLQAYVSEVNKIPVGSVLAIQNPGGGGGQTTVRQIDTDNVDMGD